MDFFSTLDFGRLGEILRFEPNAPMIFSSGLFFFLLLGFLPVYYLLRGERLTQLRILWVVIFSLYFYYKSSGSYVLLLLMAASWDYYIGGLLHRTSEPSRRKRLVALSVMLNLSVLCYFKYTNFIFASLLGLLSLPGELLGIEAITPAPWEPWDIVLPVGISFYTFQTMSYIIDIYRGEVRPLKRWIDYVFYVSFFPQLVAGPIVRAKHFIPQIYKRPMLGRAEYTEALALIVSGLFKKAIISDYISLNFVDRIFDAPTLYTGLENLLGVYGYALQIYCDFSGYSDMAIGIALILGFRFNINFDSPYQSASITEFWRRWHISLSTWLKDYLYIPLGGNRSGQRRTYINLMVTMLLGGLWHGAAARFVLWGAIHGVALAIHKYWCTLFPSSSSPAHKLPWWRRFFGQIITFHLVCFAWIFFRAETMQTAWEIIGQIRHNFHPEVLWQFIDGYRLVSFLMIIGYVLHFMGRKREGWFRELFLRLRLRWVVVLLIVLIVLVIQMRSAEVQPFIYFQF
ncbi:MAG: MBOAT family protein [Porphyromonadaceae bacterium]|nr:MBOAT family protein [Porphyromonadaceae bacterium]